MSHLLFRLIELCFNLLKQVQPPPLILDSQGREVDSAGKLITATTANIKTIKVNKKYGIFPL